MLKKILIPSLSLISLLSVAQKNTVKQFNFTIEGTITNPTTKFIYLNHKWDDKDFTDSAKITNGKFSFKLKSAEPNMYWFSNQPGVAAQPLFPFFCDNGVIVSANLKGGDSLVYSNVNAGQTQKDYMEYRMIINSFVMKQQQMNADFQAAQQRGDNSKQMEIQQEYQGLNGKYIQGMKDFIKSHPKSAISGYIIHNDFNNPNIPFEDVIQSLSYIDKSMENTKFIKLANDRVAKIRGTMIGYPATDFAQPTADGKSVKLSDYKGKMVLVDFWASWCRPCRMENPNVVAAYNKFKSKGFTVLGVSFDQNKEAWLNAVQQDNLTWTHISDLKGWGNEAGKIYNVTGIPANILVDKNGVIVGKNLRGQDLENKLAELLEAK